jgi:branched-chain amino acid aminotransferase
MDAQKGKNGYSCKMSEKFDLTNSIVYYDDGLIPFADANISIASSAVLYGLSVYTVFSINKTNKGLVVFRISDHFKRIIESCQIIGIDYFEKKWNLSKFEKAVTELVGANDIKGDVFVRATVHVTELVAGTRSRGLKTCLSMFIYPAVAIVPRDGSRLKTSVWRRVPDYAIPARAKVNGAYVNSVLAKQDAIDSGYDDCIFLDTHGHVCESSAANIFIVKNNILITPSTTSDLLEGINRKTVIELAEKLGINVEQRTVDLTELYIADEVFLCGTSAFISSVKEIDARKIGDGNSPVVNKLKQEHHNLLHGSHPLADTHLTLVGK